MALAYLSPLHKASRQLTVYLDARTSTLGVSPSEGHLLTYLARYAPAPIGELGRVFGSKPSTMTSMLHRLERAGLIRRVENPHDRRSALVRLSDRGRRLSRRLNRLLTALEGEIETRVSPEERAGFEAVMRAVDAVTRVRLRRR